MTTNFIFKYLFFVMGFAGFIHVGRSEQFIVEAGAGGNDLEFEPREPWARRHSPWAAEKQAEWEKLAGKPWMNLIGRSLYRDYNKRLDIWDFDHRGSLNAVYAFLRELGALVYAGRVGRDSADSNQHRVAANQSHGRSRLGDPEHQPSSDFVERT